MLASMVDLWIKKVVVVLIGLLFISSYCHRVEAVEIETSNEYKANRRNQLGKFISDAATKENNLQSPQKEIEIISDDRSVEEICWTSLLVMTL